MNSPYIQVLKVTGLSLALCAIISCTPPEDKTAWLAVQAPNEEPLKLLFYQTDPEILHDKILGSLVGSAIGDALGAPTEMWERTNMEVEYGYIDSLYDMVREPSPEGTWDYNLVAGSTTDDTRWKILTGEYILTQKMSMFNAEGPDPRAFGQFILDMYSREIEELKKLDGMDPEPFEIQMRRLTWLQEWAKVAEPFVDQDLQSYIEAANKFYGGEMACAGLLYSPIIGLTFPGVPEQAYRVAYNHSFFDLGYAKDLTALSAAMVASAFTNHPDPDRIVEVHQHIDPKGYFKSRLLGRVAYRIYRDVLYKVDEVHNKDLPYEEQIRLMYAWLDTRIQDVSFHAAEIHLINLSAILFTEYDFEKAMEFVINYGRDNDTVGAVTGSILGAMHGYGELPEAWKSTVIETNKSLLGIDLEELAEEMTDFLIQNQAVSQDDRSPDK